MEEVMTAQSDAEKLVAAGRQQRDLEWSTIAAGGALLAGGLLILAGKRRAGAVVAASGAALAVYDQQEAVTDFLRKLPAIVGEVQQVTTKLEGAAEQLAAQRDKLRRVLGR